LDGSLLSPEELEASPMPDDCAAELKASDQSTHTLLAADPQPSVGNILNCRDYSSMNHLLRVTAYVLRAANHFKGASLAQDDSKLNPEELANAERLWIMQAQSTSPRDKKFSTWQHQFDLFTDDKGLWRCRGRLSNADIPFATKYPILLPRDHPLTTLVVRRAHDRVGHDGMKETLTEVRRKFWIIRGRSSVKSIIHRCVLCRRFEGVPFRAPPPPPLPKFRVTEEPPFTYTGVDFAGPLYIRSFGLTQDNKAWICLFTCLVTRAVHLDITTDMSTETFLRCLKRFAARRGLPHKFLSDNGKTFKAAAKFLKTVFRDEAVVNYLSRQGIEWTFNIEKAPWWGGAFERMVQSTKRCLRKMVGRSRLTLDELHTAVVEIESIINSRPLSYISASDMEEPLTPSHLLIGRRVLNLPDHLGSSHDPEGEEFTVNPNQLSERMKRLGGALNHFWKRWRTEYLTELREAHRQSRPSQPTGPSITKGDVVIVHDDNLPRGLWKLGKVEELFPGRDGKIRGAAVKLPSTGRQHSTLNRPIQLLYPLEVGGGCNHPTGAIPGDTAEPLLLEDETSTQSVEQQIRRSRRPAARRAEDQIKAWMCDLEDC
jgi:hypothetical protein